MLNVKFVMSVILGNNDINKKRGWYETSDENTNFSLGHLEYELVTNINIIYTLLKEDLFFVLYKERMYSTLFS